MPIRHWTRRSWDLPGSCGILVLMPRSSTPVRLHRLAFPADPCCLPQCARRWLSQFPFFRGSFTQPVHSLCTLRSSGHPETTQHSVRGRWLAFAGRGSHPLDPYARFQPFLHDIPLAQACLAHAQNGNREPAKLAMRIADEHSSSAREPDDGEPNPSDAEGSPS